MNSESLPLAYTEQTNTDRVFSWMREHTEPYLCDADHTGDYFRRVIEPITVYKKTLDAKNPDREILVELLLARGSLVYMEWTGKLRITISTRGDRKMRGTLAKVIRQISIKKYRHAIESGMPEGNMDPLWTHDGSRSAFDPDFLYVNGELVGPTKPFYMAPEQCAAGVHFFLRKGDAIDYSL